MGAAVPVRPSVSPNGLEWAQRGRFWWAALSPLGCYHVTFGDPRPGAWTVLHSDLARPFREITGPAAQVVVDGLVAFLAKTGAEIPR